MRIPTLLATTAIGAFVLVPCTAMAQQATQAGAASIRSAIKQYISANLGLSNTGASLVFDGGVTVTPDGDLYDIAFGPATLTVEDQLSLHLGSITGTIEPLEHNRYQVSWTLPPDIRFEKLGDAEAQTVTIGANHGSGVFAPEFETFLSLDVGLDNIAMSIADPAGQLSIRGISVTSNSTETTPGVFDVAETMSVDGVAVEGEGEKFQIGNLTVDVNMTAMDLAAYVRLGKDLQAAYPRDAATAVDPDGFFKAVAAALEAMGGAPFDDATIRYTVRGVEVDAEGTHVTLADSGLEFGLEGLAGEKTTAHVGLSYDGLDIAPLPPFGSYIPTRTNLDLAVVDLPNAALGAAVSNFLQTAGQLGPEVAGPAAVMSAQAAILSAGTAINLRDLSIDLPDASLHAEATLRPSDTAAMGATGEGSLELGGIAGLIEDLQGDPDAAQSVDLLTMLQSLGRAATDDQGRAVQSYDFQLTEDGKLMLNGTDMSSTLDAF